MNNNNQERKTYEQQEEKIIRQSDAFISLLTKRGILDGILEDKKISSEKLRNAQKERKRSSYHNTLLMLQNYRTFAWLIECFPESLAEELEEPFTGVDSLLDRIDLETAMGNRKLDSRIECMKKSRLLLDRINEALTVLKKKPGDGERLYNLIYQTYISPEQLTHTELLYRLDLSSRHYYRL